MQWFNCWDRSEMTMQFYVGGRGIGKTYSVLHQHYIRWSSGQRQKILYIRITDKEYEMACSNFGNPYKKINNDHNLDIRPCILKGAKGVRAICVGEGDNLQIMGYMACLTSFGSVRGVDFSDIDTIYIDEFIPSENVITLPSVKRAGWSLAGMYETVARNKEILGEKPPTLFCTANAFSLDSSILQIFGLVDEIVDMLRKREKRRTIRDASIYIELAESLMVSLLKNETVLYKALARSTQGRTYSSMAINNAFNDKAFSYVRKNVNMAEYYPLFSFNGHTVYRHKSRFMFHVKHNNVKVEGYTYDDNYIDTMQLNFKFDYLAALQERTITFDKVDSYYILFDAMTLTRKK